MYLRQKTMFSQFLLFLSFVILALLTGCSLETPVEPSRNNPFDPENPDTHGDPYRLEAEIAGGGVMLTWRHVEWEYLQGYNIYRRENDGFFGLLCQVDALTNAYTDTSVKNGCFYQYYAVVRSADGEGDPSHVRMVSINSEPVLYIEGENVVHAANRNVDLTIIAFGAEKILLSNTLDFSGSYWEPFAPVKQWELSTGEGTKTVFMRVVYSSGDTSDVAADSIEPARCEPSVLIENGAPHAARRCVNLSIEAEGAIEMQLSNEPFTGSEEWIAFADSLEWELSAGVGTKTVYLNVRNDFLIEAGASDQIEPQRQQASIRIANDSACTAARNVELTIDAPGAIEMQLSNEAFIGNEQWINYEESVNWELAEGPGIKLVYLKARNDFLIEAEAVDQIEPAPIVDPSVHIISNEGFVNNCEIDLSLSASGALTVKLSNDDDPASGVWRDFSNSLVWNAPGGDGWKCVYAWYKNDFFTSDAVMDSAFLDTRVSIESFAWISVYGDSLVSSDTIDFFMQADEDAFGEETGGLASVVIGDWEPIEMLDEGNGAYSQVYAIPDDASVVENMPVIVQFTDRAGNAAMTASDRVLTAMVPGSGRDFPLGESGTMIRMNWTPPGSFEMGSPSSEQDRDDDEEPVHRVDISYSYWISACEVTQLQWESVMGYNPAREHGIGENYPVYFVSWENIQEFESALDNEYRLPSEAEWEYACRAGTETRFYWGEDLLYNEIGDYAWYWDNSRNGARRVGLKIPNDWGLFDMCGSVYEWCEDFYHDNYENAPTDGSAWLSPAGEHRALRSGSWHNDSWGCRCASRYWGDPSESGEYFGFRIVRDMD